MFGTVEVAYRAAFQRMKETPPTKWFRAFKPNPRAGARLFCFPFAGGGATTYRTWQDSLTANVEVWSAQPPGRGNRMKDAPFTNLAAMVHDVARAILPLLDKPFAIFGHSMGALVGFELVRQLRRESQPQPFRLFISGRRAPHLPRTDRATYDLPESELLVKLSQLNGTPGEIFEHAELIQLFVPLLRADFSVVDTYVYADEVPLDCPISAFGGLRDDEVSRQQLEAWREHTTASFGLSMLPGDHFFLAEDQHLLLQLISRHLLRAA